MSALDFIFLFYVLVFLPYIVLKSTRAEVRPGANLPPKEKAIWRTIVALALIGSLAIFTAYRRWYVLFPVWRPTGTELLTGLGLLVGLIVLRSVLTPWIRKGQGPNATYLRPRKWSDMPLWTLLSCCAGFFEEIVYRGVLYQILLGLTGSVLVSVLFACVVFGVVHLRQGWRAVVFITLLSASFHWVAISFGTLYTVMIVHAVYDVIAGMRSIFQAESGGIEPDTLER